ERGQGVDASEAAPASDSRPPLALQREPREPLIERRFAGDQAVYGRQRVEVGELGHRLVEPLASQPLAVALRPARRPRVNPAVQEQQLRDAVAAAHQISTDLLAGKAEVTGRLDSYTGHGDRLQLTGKQ